MRADGASSKFQDIKQFVANKKPHLFGIIEADIFSPTSNQNRLNKFDKATVKSLLSISGYSIELPDTWDEYGQARLLVYVCNDIISVRKRTDLLNKDLPTITLKIGLGKARKLLLITIIENGLMVSLVITVLKVNS